MNFSRFGTKFTRQSGILQLMEDLGEALSVNRNMLMLGGGNPAHIPEVQDHFRRRMAQMLDDGLDFARAIGDYDSPQGNNAFISALAQLLRESYGWNIGPENIALTTGSQASFFFLFNMLAGKFENGRGKKILFPMVPEYIGYSDLGLDQDIFTAARPSIEYLSDNFFKYHVDFGALDIGEDIGAICLSRPTNPTGNVVSDEELRHLSVLAESHGVPLIIDNAYGLPFPNILFTEATPVWNENTIVCLSLSKLGLPGARTGIVIANNEIIKTLSNMNAIMNLAPGSLGPALAQKMVDTGEILTLSKEIIKPFYQEKVHQAVSALATSLKGINYHIHKPEGAIFLWLWFENLPISSQRLYERLKQCGVLVVPGHFFFPGLKEDWPHRQECIRMTYSQPWDVVERAIKIIGREINDIYRNYSPHP